MKTNYNPRWHFALIAMLFFVQADLFAQANIKYTSVNPITNELIISNLGDAALDVGDFWLCRGPGTYSQVSGNTSGSTNLGPGETVTVSYTMTEAADGLSLFSTNSFSSSDPTILVDYVQWGAANQARVSQAVTAGRWDSAANFVTGIAPYTTTTGGSAAAWAPDCDADAAAIQIAGTTATETEICAGDGTPDPIDVEIVGMGVGANLGWVITDEATGTILGLPPGPPFDLEGAGDGACNIYYIRYADGLSGLMQDGNINTLEGCFDLSNPVTINRNDPDAAAIELVGGGTSVDTCAGDGTDDLIDVEILGMGVGANSGWVITDNATGEILGLPAAPPFNLEGAGAGVCAIWYIRYADGLVGLEGGANVDDLEGCFDLSNPVLVNREGVDAAAIQIAGTTETEIAICADENLEEPIDVEMVGEGTGANSGWIITDQATGEILGLPMAPPFTINGAGVGVCQIWYISYADGLEGLEGGANVADLNGCFALSNPITVTREAAEGGTVAIDIENTDTSSGNTIITDENTVSILVEDDLPNPIAVSHENPTAENLSYRYVITDAETGLILNVVPSTVIDLDGAGVGVCQIWGWSYRGVENNGLDQIGEPLSVLDELDCSDVSDNAITVNRVTTLAVEDSALEMSISLYPNPTVDVINIQVAQSSEKLSVIVYDLLGKRVHVQENAQEKMSINISDLPSGMYLLEVTDKTNNTRTIERIIKR